MPIICPGSCRQTDRQKGCQLGPESVSIRDHWRWQTEVGDAVTQWHEVNATYLNVYQHKV